MRPSSRQDPMPPEVDGRAAKTQASGNDLAANPAPASPVENSKFVPVAADSICRVTRSQGPICPRRLARNLWIQASPANVSRNRGLREPRSTNQSRLRAFTCRHLRMQVSQRPEVHCRMPWQLRRFLSCQPLEQNSKAPAKEIAENATAAKGASQSNLLIDQAAVRDPRMQPNALLRASRPG